MTDSVLLKQIMIREGVNNRKLADHLDKNENTIRRKIEGLSEFTQSEIENTCLLLNMSKQEKESVFFAKLVEL